MHWIEKLEKPIIFGHRGASRYAPENTMAAFKLVLEQGAGAIELDTMLTLDKVPIVMHDWRVDRTTNGTGSVDGLTYEEIIKLDAGLKFSEEYAGEKIPLLENVFKYFKGKALINVELKNYHDPSDDLPEIVINLAQKIGVLDQILFSSFLPSNLKKIKGLYPEARLALLCLKRLSGFLQRSFLSISTSPDYINPYYRDVTQAFMKRQNHLQRKVNAWVVNNEIDMVRLFKLNIHGIITDDPKAALRIKNLMLDSRDNKIS